MAIQKQTYDEMILINVNQMVHCSKLLLYLISLFAREILSPYALNRIIRFSYLLILRS